jgi:hypothetical protein
VLFVYVSLISSKKIRGNKEKRATRSEKKAVRNCKRNNKRNSKS